MTSSSTGALATEENEGNLRKISITSKEKAKKGLASMKMLIIILHDKLHDGSIRTACSERNFSALKHLFKKLNLG